MTALPMCLVAHKPTYSEAVRFDGSPEMAQAIIDWIRGSEPDALPKGHYRAALGDVKAAVYQPLLGTVMQAVTGQWVVKRSPMLFIAYSPDAFAAKFEVCP